MYDESDSIARKLPSIDEIERELARHSREVRLLRTLREMLRKKRLCERASQLLRPHGGSSNGQ